MRVLTTISLLAGALVALTACADNAPFQGISAVKVRHHGAAGLNEKALDDRAQKALIECLYRSVEVTEEQTLRDLLQTTYLIEVSDAHGDRSFELYTRQNLKGNKGKYYVNDCVYGIVHKSR